MGAEQKTKTAHSASHAAKKEAPETAAHAKESAKDVAGTARERARGVAGEATAQAQQVTGQMWDRVGGEAQTQAERVSHMVREWADELASMADAGRPDSPIRDAAHQVADGGHRAADYLEEHGVGGLVSELQKFARERPGAFLTGAVIVGFATGRMAKAALADGHEEPQKQQEPPEQRPLLQEYEAPHGRPATQIERQTEHAEPGGGGAPGEHPVTPPPAWR